MSQVTYNDVWAMDDSDLLISAKDVLCSKGIRAIAYARLGNLRLAEEILGVPDSADFVELEAQLFTLLAKPSFNIEEMLKDARRALELEPNIVMANFVEALYAEKNKNLQEALNRYLRILDVFPLSQRAFVDSIRLLSTGKTLNTDLGLDVVKRYKIAIKKNNTPSLKKFHLVMAAFFCELMIRSQRLEGVLLLLVLLLMSVFGYLPNIYFAVILFLNTIIILYFSAKKNGLILTWLIWNCARIGIIFFAGKLIYLIGSF